MWSDALLAIVACVSLATALGALYALAKFSVAQGRFDLDATERTNRLNSLIDSRVQERLIATEVKRPSGVLVGPDGKRVRYGEQPPDPNVRTTTIIDDVHEAEREANRITGMAEFDKRDDFVMPQPPAPEVL